MPITAGSSPCSAIWKRDRTTGTTGPFELYPGAGHGFLFQEGTPFAVTVESFLSGVGRPWPTAAIRSAYLAGQAKVTAASKAWETALSGPTAKTWTATITRDSDAAQRAGAALRTALGLPAAG